MINIQKQQEDRNKNLLSNFNIGFEYGIRIETNESHKSTIRLTQGFNFISGQAKYPTYFIVESKKYEDGIFYLNGKLRDNDDPSYKLSMEIEKNKRKIKCGYNNNGDDIELQFYRFINQSKGDHYLCYEGQIRIYRGQQSYYLVPTGYEADSNILQKANWGSQLIFHIDTFGCKSNQVNKKYQQNLSKIF